MSDDMDAAGAGTATQVGSQAAGAGSGSAAGEEGVTPEPTVRIGDRDVPLSVAQRALKNDENFTQVSQRLSDRAKDLDAREARTLGEQTRVSHLGELAPQLQDPKVREAISAVNPELASRLPGPVDERTLALAGENLRLTYELFVTKNGGTFDDDQLSRIRAESARLASQGRVEEAVDFESIGYRLFKDAIIDREATARAQALVKAKAEEAKRKQEAGGSLPPGVPPIPKGIDPTKLTAVQKLSLGRLLHSKQS